MQHLLGLKHDHALNCAVKHVIICTSLVFTGRDAATDEDSDNGDANEDAPSASTAAEPLQAHGVAADQANSGNANKAPASDTDQIPTSSSAGAAVSGPHHTSVTEAEQAPTTDTDSASASGTQASPAEADQPTTAGADKAPAADTDSIPITSGTPDFASHTPAGDSNAASTSDAGQIPAPSATGADTASASDIDRDVAMESVDKGDEEGTAATEGGDSGDQAEPSKGDKTATSTVQAEAPPTSTIAGWSFNQSFCVYLIVVMLLLLLSLLALSTMLS